MKNPILTLIFFTLFACQNNTNNGSGNSKVKDYISISNDSLFYDLKTYVLNPLKCDTLNDLNCKAYVKAIYPIFKNDAPLNNFIDTLIASNPAQDKSNYIGLDKAAKAFLQNYAVFKKDYPKVAAGYAWDQKINVAKQDSCIISFTHRIYIYTAGAHGLETYLYYNWDKKNNKVLRLNDILVANYNDDLRKIAEQIFRKDEKLSPSQSLNGYFFENQKFKLNKNFLITPKGLKFLFNPYEIKAYAYGQTKLLVPYSKIQGLIKSNGCLSKYKTK
ncbi:DUF3298 domain-containing protein [Pedobacter sp. SD-b]|uniref:DUF3298 domain-containing protein n=1 Tax=Pedobacter segetis TaxID=2793069 RepID=A0ABS1BPL4_9SPHI|nr:DUF3298 and DUF4163 domain-containing protein [Pedobacter segetis]MBK0384401.1 DUF3298 domain-containing protein [Pedobacter segetis]